MNVAVVIPCYNVERSIYQVIEAATLCCDQVICVNDCSRDNTAQEIQRAVVQFPGVALVEHQENAGVGGAMLTGFAEAIRRGADIIVKMDGDGQMDPAFIPKLVEPLQRGEADFAKGNRFNDFSALRKMPLVRRLGNLGMSFLLKAASGYWDIFDPTNGYFAITAAVAAKLNHKKIARRYFFESSLLIEMYYHGVVIKEVAMPAIYGDEKSNLSVSKVLFEFPPRILKALLRRIVLRYYIYDLNIASFYLFFGVLLFGWGSIFGIVKYIHFKSLGMPAPTGTVVLPTVGIVLGFQLLLAAINFDIERGKLKS